MNDVANSSSLNKPIKINLNICMHIFYFLFFLFFILFIYLFGAGRDPASPTRSLAQASDPDGQRHAQRVRAQ
jgi:hypothetical protein